MSSSSHHRRTSVIAGRRGHYRGRAPVGTGAFAAADKVHRRQSRPSKLGSGYRLRFGYYKGTPVIREFHNGVRQRPVTFSSSAKPRPFYREGDALIYGKTNLKWIKRMFPGFKHADPDSLQLLLQAIAGEEPTFWYVYKIKKITPDKTSIGSGRVSVETLIGYKDAGDKMKWVRVGDRTASETRDLSSFYHISVLSRNMQKHADMMERFIKVQMAAFEVATGGITTAGKAVMKEAVKETIEKIAKDAVKKKILKKQLAKRVAKQAHKAIAELTQLLTSVGVKAAAAFVYAFASDLIKRYGWQKIRQYFASGGSGTVISNAPDGVPGTQFEFTLVEIDFKPSIENGVLAATQVVISEFASQAFKKKIKEDMKLRRALQQVLGEDAILEELTGAFEQKFKQMMFKVLVTDNLNGFIDSVGKAMQATKTSNTGEFQKNLAKEVGNNIRGRMLSVMKDALSALAEA